MKDTRFEYSLDGQGSHRIVVEGDKSQWVGYMGVARLQREGGIYVGFSDYYAGSLPTECVIRIEVVSTEMKEVGK